MYTTFAATDRWNPAATIHPLVPRHLWPPLSPPPPASSARSRLAPAHSLSFVCTSSGRAVVLKRRPSLGTPRPIRMTGTRFSAPPAPISGPELLFECWDTYLFILVIKRPTFYPPARVPVIVRFATPTTSVHVTLDFVATWPATAAAALSCSP